MRDHAIMAAFHSIPRFHSIPHSMFYMQSTKSLRFTKALLQPAAVAHYKASRQILSSYTKNKKIVAKDMLTTELQISSLDQRVKVYILGTETRYMVRQPSI